MATSTPVSPVIQGSKGPEASDTYSVSEKDGYVILSAFDVAHETKMTVKINEGLFKVLELAERMFMPVPTEVVLLTIKDGVHGDINHYIKQVKQLKEDEKWWQVEGVKEIPVSSLKRRHPTSLVKLMSMLKYLNGAGLSLKDFIEREPIDVLDLSDGSYYVLDGTHRSDLACLSGFKTINARIFKAKETFDEEELIYGISRRAQQLDGFAGLNDFSGKFFASIESLKELAEYFPDFVKYQVNAGQEELKNESVLTCNLPAVINTYDRKLKSAYEYVGWLMELFWDGMPEIRQHLPRVLSEGVNAGIFEKEGEYGNIFKSINGSSNSSPLGSEETKAGLIVINKTSSPAGNERREGGIDLKNANSIIETKGSSADLALPQARGSSLGVRGSENNEQQTPSPEQLNTDDASQFLLYQDIQGLVPVIINITPVMNIFQAMGLNADEEQRIRQALEKEPIKKPEQLVHS